MPEYNGPTYFAVEVLVHLLRNYLAWIILFAFLLPAPFAIATLMREGVETTIQSWLPLQWPVSSWLSFAHVMTFFTFRYYFQPRFPYASPYTTFAVAAAIGAVLLGVNWTLSSGTWAGETLINRFLWAGVVTVGIAAIGMLTFELLGWRIFRWGPGRWLGWFVVGREPYEAMVEKAQARK